MVMSQNSDICQHEQDLITTCSSSFSLVTRYSLFLYLLTSLQSRGSFLYNHLYYKLFQPCHDGLPTTNVYIQQINQLIRTRLRTFLIINFLTAFMSSISAYFRAIKWEIKTRRLLFRDKFRAVRENEKNQNDTRCKRHSPY